MAGERPIPTDVELLWLAVADAATDAERFEALRVLADAYRESGDEVRADACAWAAATRRLPSVQDWPVQKRHGFVWLKQGARSGARDIAAARGEEHDAALPRPVFLTMAEDLFAAEMFATPADAYRGLVEAFAAASASGWRPEGVPV